MPPTRNHGKICYVELPATDVLRSATFYEAVFGWRIRKRGDGQLAFDDTTGEVSGSWCAGRPPASPGVLFYIMVDSVAAAVEAVRAHGGEIVQPIGVDAPEITARFRDPGGNVIGLYQEPQRAPEGPTPERIMQTGLAFWAAKTLLSAVELGLFSELARGPESFEPLRGRLGLHPRSARDFLDTLVALGLLQREGDRYANTADTDLFLDRKKPSYVGGVLEMAGHRLYPFWGHLTEALRTGLPQNEVKSGGPGLFETLYADPARLKQFLAAMTGISHGANLAIARKFPWKDYRSFVDVGTAQGDLAAQVARAHPHLHGIGFDLPEVAPIFEEYAAGAGVSDRLVFRPGDFFKQDLPSCDVVMMGHILHDWDLPTKQMLVRKAYAALPAGGALIVYESIIDDDRSKNAFGLLMSLNMLIETPGGFDYTGADCRGWMEQAGFTRTRVEPLVGPDSMVIGIK
ncbi:MAG TPA: methyltransferase [Candidatus Polarisedimenticolaceae bacterium]|nr:methyltransferase [Candidatus Polarisedimenticolaceae bacterium]